VPYRHSETMPHTPDVDAIHPFGKIPVMRHGEKVFCRLVEETGSHLGVRKECGTAKELAATWTQNREEWEKAQRIQINPSGR